MQHPKPVIAAINGWCIGGGFWYSLACDVTIASDQATFGQPEVRMTSNTTVLFAILCGWKNAHRYALTGDHCAAAEALRIGLVNEVVPHAELMDRARELALRLSRVPSESVRLNKAITTYGLDAKGRVLYVSNALAPHFLYKVDNLGRTIATGRFSSGASIVIGTDDPTTETTNRNGLTEFFFDERGNRVPEVHWSGPSAGWKPRRGRGRDSKPRTEAGWPPRKASQTTPISASSMPYQRSRGSRSWSMTAAITRRMSKGFLRPALPASEKVSPTTSKPSPWAPSRTSRSTGPRVSRRRGNGSPGAAQERS